MYGEGCSFAYWICIGFIVLAIILYVAANNKRR